MNKVFKKSWFTIFLAFLMVAFFAGQMLPTSDVQRNTLTPGVNLP
ncbi:MAG TPA: hypothetical protein VGL56_03315 [Fimbriimonadaceae bacterium]